MTERSQPEKIDIYIKILTALTRTLQRESHVLTRDPDLLWQQLYNRLQWEGEEVKQVFAPELVKRSAVGVKPWLHIKTPYRESVSLVRTLEGHTRQVEACTFSPDGDFIYSVSRDGMIGMWNSANGMNLRSTKISEQVDNCSFSPDGKYLVSACAEEMLVRVWDATTGQLIQILQGHTGSVLDCVFSPDGHLIASTGDQTLRVWDTLTGRCLHILEGHTKSVTACAFSPDGRFIISASRDRTVRVWDVTTSQVLRILDGRHDEFYSCTFSPDGRLIAAGGYIWVAADGKLLCNLIGHHDVVEAYIFSPDGRFIASASWDMTVRVWDVATGQELHKLEGHTDWVHACAFSPDGQFIISAGNDKTLRIWDWTKDQPLHSTFDHTKSVFYCEFSPDGCLIASVDGGGKLRVLDSNTSETVHQLESSSTDLYSCAFSPDGRLIVSAGNSYDLQVWETATGEVLRTLKTDADTIYYDCVFSPDGLNILAASEDFALRIWDISSEKLLHTLEDHNTVVSDCAFSPDGRFIVSADWNNLLKIWNAATGQLLHTLEGRSCSYSPDGRLIISASQDQLWVWDATNGHPIRTLKGHTDSITTCVFSPDGHFIASSGDDRIVRVWNIDDGEILANLMIPGTHLSLGFHPWVPRLVCGDDRGNLHQINLIGLEYGPIVITATEKKQNLELRCPACQQAHLVTPAHLGMDITCPTPKCGLHLHLNPFVVGHQSKELVSQISVEPAIAHKRVVPQIDTLRQNPLKVAVKPIELRSPCSLAFALDGLLITGYSDGSLGIWDQDMGEPEIMLDSHSASITTLAVAPEGWVAVSGSSDGVVRLWDLHARQVRAEMKFSVEVSALAVFYGLRVAVGLGNGSLSFWEIGSHPVYFDAHKDQITTVTFLSSGQIACAAIDLKISRWDPKTQQMLNRFSGLTSPITVMSAATVGNRVVCGCKDGLQFLWDFDTQAATGTERGKPTLLAAASARSWILSAGIDGIAQVFDLETKKTVYHYGYGLPIKGGTLSPDGRWGAVCDEQGKVYRFEVGK